MGFSLSYSGEYSQAQFYAPYEKSPLVTSPPDESGISEHGLNKFPSVPPQKDSPLVTLQTPAPFTFPLLDYHTRTYTNTSGQIPADSMPSKYPPSPETPSRPGPMDGREDDEDEGDAGSPHPSPPTTPGARDAPKNEKGEYYCDHIHCANKAELPTFPRRCEWR